MRLNAWLKQNSLTQQMFLEISRGHGAEFTMSALNKWCSGSRIPRSQEMAIIYKVTDGQVQPNDFYNFTHQPVAIVQ